MPADSLNVKESRLYIKFETNHTIWTITKPLTCKIFLCTIFFFCRINEAFLVMHASLQGSVSQKTVFIIKVFFIFVEKVWYQSSKGYQT